MAKLVKGDVLRVFINGKKFYGEKTFTVDRTASTEKLIKKTGNERYVNTTAWSLTMSLFMTVENHEYMTQLNDVFDIEITDVYKGKGVYFTLPFILPNMTVSKDFEFNKTVFQGKGIIESMKEVYNDGDMANIEVSILGVSKKLELKQ